MSLRCPRCGTVIPRWKILWFLRLFAFRCTQCSSPLALTWRWRTALVGSVVASALLYLLVKHLTDSDTLAIIAFVAGVTGGHLMTWQIGELGILVDAGEGTGRSDWQPRPFPA